jgi:hypothetical protein
MKLDKQLILNTNLTKNNRKYSRRVLESIKTQINENDGKNYGTMDYPKDEIVNFSEVGFMFSNAIIEGDSLYCDITLLETKVGETIKSLLPGVVFRPIGSATIKGEIPTETLNLLKIPNLVNDDYQLICISAIEKSRDAISIDPVEKI